MARGFPGSVSPATTEGRRWGWRGVAGLSEPGDNGGGEQRAGPRRGSLTGPFDGYLLYLLKLFAVGVFDPFRFLEVEPPNEEVCDCLKDCGDHATYSTCQNLAWKTAHHDQANQLDADESKQPYQ